MTTTRNNLSWHRYACYYCIIGIFLSPYCTPGSSSRQNAAYFATARSAVTQREHYEDSNRFFFAVDSVFDRSHWGRFFRYMTIRDYFFTYKRDYHKGETYSDSAMQAIQYEQDDPDYTRWHAQALLSKGDDLMAMHRPTDAFLFYYQARENIFQTADTCTFSDFNGRLGTVAYQQKKYKESIIYYQLAYEELGACTGMDYDKGSQFLYQQANLDNIALCYNRIGMYDSALYYFDSALHYINRYHQNSNPNFVEQAIGIVYGNKAQALLYKGDTANAEALLKESIRINSRPYHSNGDVAFGLNKLAGIYIAQARFAEARRMLDQCKLSLDTIPNLEVQLRWDELQNSYYEKMNDLHTAHQYLRHYTIVKDSMAAIQQRLATIDMDKEFAYIKNEFTVADLERENSLKSLYLLLTGLGVGLTLIIIFLIFRNYRQSRKHISTLQVLNDAINTKNDHLQKTLNALEQSQDENNRMLRIIAHDLRNPVGNMASLANLVLAEEEVPLSDSQKEMLHMIHTSGQHSLTLIQDILHFNAEEANLEMTDVELYPLLKYCADMLHSRSEEKKQQVILDITERPGICGDREKLWRVFSNLISNAIKFSPQKTAITISLHTTGKEAVVSVADKGIGIPETLRGKLFKLSAEVKRKGTDGEPSFGLGLAICKQIVEAHGGRIWLGDEMDGTVFYVALPIEQCV